MSLNKITYFKHRKKNLKTDKSRLNRGEREVNSLLSLLKVSEKDLPFPKKFKSYSNCSVLDLGCGDMHLKEPLTQLGFKYFGLDIQDANFETDKLPFKENNFDIVLSLAVLEHIFDPSVFLSQIMRVLKKGGLLWLSTPDIKACGMDFWNDPTHIHPYTPKSLKYLLKMYGFKHVKVSPNYLSKKPFFYKDNRFFFLYSRLIPLKGVSSLPLPEFLKGNCSGIYGIGRKI